MSTSTCRYASACCFNPSLVISSFSSSCTVCDAKLDISRVVLALWLRSFSLGCSVSILDAAPFKRSTILLHWLTLESQPRRHTEPTRKERRRGAGRGKVFKAGSSADCRRSFPLPQRPPEIGPGAPYLAATM